jgi:hypothetical protein
MNRENYGDARLDRMFAQGLDVLFGVYAGRAKGKSRELREGDALLVTLEEAGIFGKPKPVEHKCKVLTATPEEVVLHLEWRIHGFDPQLENGEIVTMRGGDIRGARRITFLPRGGLVTRLEETIERTDQSVPGPKPGVVQWTREAKERKVFTLVNE